MPPSRIARATDRPSQNKQNRIKNKGRKSTRDIHAKSHTKQTSLNTKLETITYKQKTSKVERGQTNKAI